MDETTSVVQMHPRLLAQLDRFLGAAQRIWPNHYRTDSCIAAARVCVDVLGALHYRVEPLPCMAEIVNAAYLAKGRAPSTADEAAAWLAEGCWRVLLGGGEQQPGYWPGHLLVVVNRTVAIDLTLGQACRPHKGILLGAHAFPVHPSFLSGAISGVGIMNGCQVTYTAEPGNRGYLAAKDWRDRARHAKVVRQLLAAIK